MTDSWPLKILFWECTLRCNAFCAFCGSRCGEVVSEELTTEEILRVFRDVAQKMDASRIMINVTGGEPLLRRDLFDVMTQCVSMGFSWGMVTNGMGITPETVEKMRSSGMKTISVSLDGLEATHEALRGVPGSFRKVIRGLELLREGDFLEHIQVTTVVSRQNIGQLEALYGLLKPMGLTSWRLAAVDPIGRAKGQENLLLGPEEWERYLSFIRAHRDDPDLPVVTTCSHYLGPWEKEVGRTFSCNTGKTVASILCNGDIFVCPNVPRRPELIQGNVRTDSLPEVWQKGFAFFRDPGRRRGEDCVHCPHWPECQGDSCHTWDFETGEAMVCFRKLFPGEQGEDLPALEEILPRLKERTENLRGIHIRYGRETGLPVVFTPNASRELHRFFRWGERHPQNLSEQMAALIGHRLSDALLVEFVSPAWLEARSTAQAWFSGQSLDSGRMETAAINEHYADCPELCLMDDPCQLLGFVHSHPDDLNLFLSEGDVNLHRHLLREGISLTMIVNPQKRQLLACHGDGLKFAEIRLLMQARETDGWQIT